MGFKDKHTFDGINQDKDARLLQPNEFVSALNCRIATTESNTLGAVTNVKGNTSVTSIGAWNGSAYEPSSLPSGS